MADIGVTFYLFVLAAVTIPTIDSGPLYTSERDESGFYTVGDFGKLITDTCDKLDNIQATMNNPFVSGAASQIMNQPLPFPNLAILDIFGILEFVTKYLGMLQDWLNEMMSGKKPPPPKPADVGYGDYGDESAPVKKQDQGSLMMTPADLLNGLTYACKALNLVGNILQAPVTSRLSLPIPDPAHIKNATVAGAVFDPLGLVSVIKDIGHYVVSPIVDNTVMPLINLVKNAILAGGEPPTTTPPPTTTASSSGWGIFG